MKIVLPQAISNSYRGERVLVTGAAGAIGGHLTHALSLLDTSIVLAIDDLSQGMRWNLPAASNITFIHGGVQDESTLEAGFAERPSVVFHLAALFANQRSIEVPEVDLITNGLGTLRVLEQARRVGARVVFASTSCALAQEPGGEVDEDTPPVRCETPYQITKALGEQYCRFFNDYHGLPTVRLRFFNSYGPGEIPGPYRNVIPNFFQLAMAGEPLRILGDGQQTRDWTFVGDIIDGLLRAGVSADAVGHAIHLASGRETTVLELAGMINRLTSNRAGVVHEDQRRWDLQSRRRTSTDKARALLGFEAQTSLLDGLSRTADWFVSNWARIQDPSSAVR